MNRDDLKAYIDGELTAQKSIEIREEIARDGNLAQDVAFLKLLGEGIRDASVEPPVLGANEVLARFKKKRTAQWPVYALGGFGCLVIAALVFPVFAQAKVSAKRVGESGFFSSGADDESVASTAAAGEARDSAKATAANPGPQAMAKAVRGGFNGSFGGARRSAAGDVSGDNSTSSLMSLTESHRDDPSLPNGQANTPAPMPAIVNSHRMVVQNGDLDEVVRDVASTENTVMAYAKGVGGFVESSSFTKNQFDLPQANLTVKVPVSMFTETMKTLESLAIDNSHIKSVNVTGNDVTAQYADTSARLNVMGAEEDSYVTMLRHARKLGEILEIKDRLSSVRQEIESLHAQTAALKNTSELSTINLVLEQNPKLNSPEPVSSWSDDTWTSALNGLRGTSQFLATIGIFLLVFSPIWIPLGLVGIWLYRKNR
jgi:hypothetical protein